MAVYLGLIQTVTHRIPVESLADMSIKWLDSKKLLESPSSVILSGFNEPAIDSVLPIIARMICAYFIYPQISHIAGVFNGTIGIIHLGVGFTQRFRTLETPKNAPETWNAIALNIHKGFAHLLTAGYDFGIGYLLMRKYFDLAGVVAFAALPALALLWHQYVFRKPEVPIAKVAPPSKVESFINIENLSPPPELKNEPAKVIPTYLAPSCLIYTLAKKITLELMPSKDQEPPENIVIKVGRTLRRISGMGGEPPLPDFGL